MLRTPTSHAGTSLDEALLTIAQVAQKLQVHVRTVRRMIARGDLPAIGLGRQYRIRRADFEAFLAARRLTRVP